MRVYALFHALGVFLLIEGLLVVLSAGWSLYEGESAVYGMAFAAVVMLLCGLLLYSLAPPVTDIRIREAIGLIVLSWLVITLFGALPFLFTGAIPSITDAIFESVSGFTTTGSSILTDIESLPRGILLWRSMTHFLGGMGIIFFVLTIIPSVGVGGMMLLRSESPSLSGEQREPMLAHWLRKILWIYIGLVVLQTLLLMLADVSFFDAVNHAIASIATGGFSNKNTSVASLQNGWAEFIIIVFMLAGGMNFAVYYLLWQRQFRKAIKRDDVRFYAVWMAVMVVLTTVLNLGTVYPDWWTSLRYSSFNAVSIGTTTGFATVDTNAWPAISRLLLVLLTMVGACAGSTSGAIKGLRILILLKCLVREIRRMLHPAGVFIVRVNGIALQESEITKTIMYIVTYVVIWFVFSLVIVFTDGDLLTALTGVAATLGGVGPGLGAVGSMGNFAGISVAGKWIFSLVMLLGRLEIFAFFAFFYPPYWYAEPLKWNAGESAGRVSAFKASSVF